MIDNVQKNKEGILSLFFLLGALGFGKTYQKVYF